MEVKELDTLCEEFIKLKEAKEKAEAEVEKIAAQLKVAQTALIAMFEKLDKDEYSGAFGKLKIAQREYYKMQDKEVVMNWLKETGDYDDLVTVNAQTFSSHVKGILEERRAAGDFAWLPPGVVDSTSDYKHLKLTKPKR